MSVVRIITWAQPKRFLVVNSLPPKFSTWNHFLFLKYIIQTEAGRKIWAGYVGHRSETRISYTIQLWPENPTGMKSPENIMRTSDDNTEKDLREMQ